MPDLSLPAEGGSSAAVEWWWSISRATRTQGTAWLGPRLPELARPHEQWPNGRRMTAATAADGCATGKVAYRRQCEAGRSRVRSAGMEEAQRTSEDGGHGA